jgi:hypothetical protein
MALQIETKLVTLENLNKDTEFLIQGNIVNESKELVVKGIPVCKELESLDELKEIYVNNSEKYRLRRFIDGTMIRVFYNELESKWFVSTNRCLDAKMSKWSNTKSFGEYFYELLTNLYHKDEKFENEEQLLNKWFNKNFSYYFLIGSKDMNVVENIESDYVYLLNVLDKEFKEVQNYDFIYKLVPEVGFKDLENEEFVKNENRGFMIENTDMRYVYFVKNYQEKRKSFGNEKYLGLRLIDLMWGNDKQLLDDYLVQYPQHKKFINDINKTKNLFCKEAHILYKRRYIQKQFVKTTPELHYFVKKMYEKYQQDHKPTLLKDIEEKFDEYSKYSKFIFLRNRLALINPKLVGNYKKNKVEKVVTNQSVKKVVNKSNKQLDTLEYESEFPPLH